MNQARGRCTVAPQPALLQSLAVMERGLLILESIKGFRRLNLDTYANGRVNFRFMQPTKFERTYMKKPVSLCLATRDLQFGSY